MHDTHMYKHTEAAGVRMEKKMSEIKVSLFSTDHISLMADKVVKSDWILLYIFKPIDSAVTRQGQNTGGRY